MVRNTLLILFAIVIDGAQAVISMGLLALGAAPGTVAGGATGCLVGHTIAGKIGCYVAGGAAGVAGSLANPILAAYTIPLAIAAGFAVNFCLNITLGTILTAWLITQKMYYPRYGVTGYIVELVPGINDLPIWTMTTVLAVMRKNAEEGKLAGTAGAMFSKFMTSGVIGTAATGISVLNQTSQKITRDAGVFTQEEQDSVQEQKKQQVSSELKNIDGIRASRTPAGDNGAQTKLQYAA
jgi:hypothetical protein